MKATLDPWAQWLLHKQFGRPYEDKRNMQEALYPIRDQVLDLARITNGDIVLDVGSGDGLVAFGALERIGENGKVIFSDVSQTLLDHCQSLASQRRVLEKCQFMEAPAENLNMLTDASVNVVTVRSVLIYIQYNQQAFSEFYRVLQPHGRLAIYEPLLRFEPLNQFIPLTSTHFLWGFDITHIQAIASKVQSIFEQVQPPATDPNPMTNFDERDMLSFAARAGFTEISLTLQAKFLPQTAGLPWAHFLELQLNPLVPTIKEAIQQTLTKSEIAQFTAHLRPLVESGRGFHRASWMLIQAVKHATSL